MRNRLRKSHKSRVVCHYVSSVKRRCRFRKKNEKWKKKRKGNRSQVYAYVRMLIALTHVNIRRRTKRTSFSVSHRGLFPHVQLLWFLILRRVRNDFWVPTRLGSAVLTPFFRSLIFRLQEPPAYNDCFIRGSLRRKSLRLKCRWILRSLNY